ncbi:MAG: 50S ribosomal protein L25 [Candidatus Zixiibacteriota bacterium]
MREIPVSLQRRSGVGKGVARQARMAGKIPGVVYGPETDPMPVVVEERAFRAAMRHATKSSILNLNLDGRETKAVVRELQRDPVTNRVLHVDFHAISMNKPIHVAIPIHFVGTPVGVKVDGGIMQTTMREIEISCLPTAIPEHLQIDVSELHIGDSVHVKNIQVPGATILSDQQRTIVVISAPTIIKAEEVAAEAVAAEGEAAEGAPTEGAEAAPAEGEAAKKEEGKGAKSETKPAKGEAKPEKEKK